MQLADKVVLITGASSGIGEQTAYAAAKAGAIVVVAARRQAKLEQVAARCQQYSQRPSMAVEMDITQVTQVDTVYKTIQQHFHRLDVVINAAGFGKLVDLVDFDFDTIEQLFRVNTLGVMYVTQKAAQLMLKQGSGEIVNIASIAGKIPTPKSSIYAATKAALIAFDDALRLELRAAGINVLTVNPGPIKTDFFKIADPDGNYLQQVGWLAMTPAELAAKIVHQIGRHRRELNVPWVFNLADFGYRMAPKLGDWLAGSVFNFK